MSAASKRKEKKEIDVNRGARKASRTSKLDVLFIECRQMQHDDRWSWTNKFDAM